MMGLFSVFSSASSLVILWQKFFSLVSSWQASCSLMPRMVKILMEGLIPVSESVKEFLQKRDLGKGRELTIGLDAAVAVGHPAVIATALRAGTVHAVPLRCHSWQPRSAVRRFGYDLLLCRLYHWCCKGNIVSFRTRWHDRNGPCTPHGFTNIAEFHTGMAIQMANFQMPANTTEISESRISAVAYQQLDCYQDLPVLLM